MQAESSDIRVCPSCHGDVLQAVTDRYSKGQQVSVLVEVEETEPEQLESNIRNDYVITRYRGKLRGGQPTSRAQREAMILNGVRVHKLHTTATCKRQKTARR